MKVAVYAGTKNLYSDMATAAKSLANNSSVDLIYFLIEDSEFPYYLPDYIRCIDVSGQKFFSKSGPNVYRLWTWMVLMRAVLSKIFPEHDRILSLDVDTIVKKNIDELWDICPDNKYLAGCIEPSKSKLNKPYINMGVVVFNLRMLRDTKMDDKIISRLNRDKFNFAEQDCINLLCENFIETIPSIYNSNNYTELCREPKIRHYANEKDWRNKEDVKYYRNLSWDLIRR